jgi:hypothetical protein
LEKNNNKRFSEKAQARSFQINHCRHRAQTERERAREKKWEGTEPQTNKQTKNPQDSGKQRSYRCSAHIPRPANIRTGLYDPKVDEERTWLSPKMSKLSFGTSAIVVTAV